MHSFVSPDPIGVALAWLPVALALFGAFLAISIALITLLFDALGRWSGRHAEPAPAPA